MYVPVQGITYSVAWGLGTMDVSPRSYQNAKLSPADGRLAAGSPPCECTSRVKVFFVLFFLEKMALVILAKKTAVWSLYLNRNSRTGL